MTSEPAATPERFDVVVLGGAIAGAATALLLRRRRPELRVLVLERNERFDWKVGESTVEISGYFLTRVLKLHDYLHREQLTKQSFRFWFHNARVRSVRQASEVGPNQLARVPSFQLDRAKLDEHVLGLAVAEGALLRRPATVVEVRLPEETGESDGVVRYQADGTTHEVRAGWIVDATGRQAVIARKRGWLKPIRTHPTAAVWARYRGVKDLDGPEICGHDPDDRFARSTVAARKLATNHFTGYGYWMWLIPLHGGQVSVGAVWDKRLVDPPGRNAQERLDWFVKNNPLTAELTEHARPEPGDVRMYASLPYLCDRVAGPGWSAVGDAAGFIDPFYSPGLDQTAFSVSATLTWIDKCRMCADREMFAADIRRHCENYRRFLAWYYDGTYRDKYYLMGDFDTLTAAFLMDTAVYYITMVYPLYKWGSHRLQRPPYYNPKSRFVFPLIRFYQRRLIAIAKRRHALGVYGSRNAGRRVSLPGFSLGIGTAVMAGKGLLRWLGAELRNLLSYVWHPRPRPEYMPAPYAPPVPAAVGVERAASGE
jgi:flavin-dependent dehydrogenase